MRLIDADALIDALMAYTWRDEDERLIDDADEKREFIKIWMPDLPTVGGWISVKEVASIIAGLFGDSCACNNNDIDEWLPKYCEYRDTDCPYPPGASCWEQYLKHLDKKTD